MNLLRPQFTPPSEEIEGEVQEEGFCYDCNWMIQTNGAVGASRKAALAHREANPKHQVGWLRQKK